MNGGFDGELDGARSDKFVAIFEVGVCKPNPNPIRPDFVRIRRCK